MKECQQSIWQEAYNHQQALTSIPFPKEKRCTQSWDSVVREKRAGRRRSFSGSSLLSDRAGIVPLHVLTERIKLQQSCEKEYWTA